VFISDRTTYRNNALANLACTVTGRVMSTSGLQVGGLTVVGCQQRQLRLRERMRHDRIDRMVLIDRRHVYYVSGYWASSHYTPVMLLTLDGLSHLVAPDKVDPNCVAANQITIYESNRLGTLIDDQLGAALEPLQDIFHQSGRMALDLPGLDVSGKSDVHDASKILLDLRRAKDDDEISLIRDAIRGCEAAYARAAEIVQPGVREIDVFAEMHSAAVKELGEPIGELGNDFQAGTPGGPPRQRAIQRGELMPLDVSVSVRGYRCDLCRTFAVGREPSQQQREAAKMAERAIEFVEQNVREGTSCRQLYETVKRQLEGSHGWQFFHHLGHGIGLSAHESPRLNPYWDDSFAIGDVFTVEPGLYDEPLRAGVRIEQNYWLSASGLKRLSNFPTEL
jgi:Xaa-Pro dipeptidase